MKSVTMRKLMTLILVRYQMSRHHCRHWAVDLQDGKPALWAVMSDEAGNFKKCHLEHVYLKMGADMNFRYYYKTMFLSKCKPVQTSQDQQVTRLYDNMFKLRNKLGTSNIVVKDEHSRDKRLDTHDPTQMTSTYKHDVYFGGCLNPR